MIKIYVKINSHRAWDKLLKEGFVKDFHYYSKSGIMHIQEIPDGTNLSRIKGVKVVKRIPKEELHLAWEIRRYKKGD